MPLEWKLVGLSFAFGALLFGVLWLILRSPWLGLFGVSVCLGRFLLDNCRLQAEQLERRREITCLDKQIAALRNVMGQLTLLIMEIELEHRLAGHVRPVSVS